MKRDTIMRPGSFNSSFLSVEKDIHSILRKLFIESQPYSDYLKRLLVINAPDCLDKDNQEYAKTVKKLSLADLKEEGYIKIVPKITFGEHEKVKSYIIINIDDFGRTTNDEFRDCIISFDILCHTDEWDLGGFALRPIKIAGYIDGILNNTKLSGIGRLEFLGLKELLLDENLSGYTLTYRAVHGSDDRISYED